MAADNTIVVSIEIDNSSVRDSAKEFDSATKDFGKDFSDRLSRNVTNNIELFNNQIQKAKDETITFADVLTTSTGAFAILGNFVGTLSNQIGALFGGIATRATGATRGIFSITAQATALAAVFDSLAIQLSKSDDEFVRLLGTITRVAGFLVGGFAFAITLIITKVGELAFRLGSRLVGVFQDATDQFIQAERQLVVFSKTIEAFNRVTNNAIGTTESWNSLIGELSNELNLSVTSLQRAATEIVQVGTRLGLTRNQLEQLLRVTAEYAKINNKDVFEASVAFVSGLNGQSQALTNLGIKLTESANQAFLLKSGFDENFRTLKDNDKVQVRYFNLLSQYNDIAGLAAATTLTLAEQGERLRINQERLQVSFGRGAAVIENNNLVAAAFNSVLNNISETTAEVVGFIGALGARVLQVTGLFLQFSFQILAVTKGLQLVNQILASNLFAQAFSRTLPLINISLAQLLSNLTGIQTRITSVSQLLRALGGFAATALAGLPGVFANIAKSAVLFIGAIAPFVARLGVTIGLFTAFAKAIEEVEKRTRIFSDTLNILRSAIDFSGITDSFVGPLQALRDLLLEIGQRVIGVFIFAIGGLVQAFNLLIQSIPFAGKVLGTTFTAKLDEAANKLRILNEELLNNRFSFQSVAEVAQASTGKIVEALSIQNEAVGGSKIVFDGFFSTVFGFFNLIGDTFSSFASKFAEVNKFTKEELQQLAQGFGNTFARGITSAIGATVEAFAKGQNAFEALGKSILALIGDLAIFIGQFIVATGIAKLALETLPGGATIAAGLGLIALGTLLKALGGSSSAFLGGGGIAGAGPGFNPADPIGPDVNPIEDEEERDTTRVAITIQGDVFDTEETGLRLVDILNQSFDTKGTRLVTA